MNHWWPPIDLVARAHALRLAVATTLLVIASCLVSGCVSIVGTPTANQPAASGTGTIVVHVDWCINTRTTPGTGTCGSNSIGSSLNNAALMIGVRAPDGLAAPATFSDAGHNYTFTRQPTYEALLTAANPPATGFTWYGYRSNGFPASAGNNGTLRSIDIPFDVPQQPGGAALASPFKFQVVQGGQGALADPIACSSASVCIENIGTGQTAVSPWTTLPNQTVSLSYASRDLGIAPGTTTSIAAGSAGDAPFTATYAGPVLAGGANFTIGTSSTGPGFTVTPVTPTFTPAADSTSTLKAHVVVPAATAPGTYDVTLTATIAGDITRTATGSVTVTAPLDTTPPLPNPMTATGVANSATQITWTAASATDETLLSPTPYSIDTGTPAWQASRTFVESTGLVANTQYTRSVRARDAAGNVRVGTVTLYTLPTAPSAATAVAQPWDTSSSYAMQLGWTKPPNDAASYEIRSSANGYATVLTTSATTSKLVSGLTANTAYTFKICARNADGAAETTCTLTGSATTPPAAPGSPSSTVLSDTSAQFSWSGATGASKYRLVLYPNAACTVGTELATIDPASSPHTYSSLLPDRTYSFRVASFGTAANTWGPSTACTQLSSATQRTALGVSVDAPTKPLGSGRPGDALTGSTTITTVSYGAPGYDVSASYAGPPTDGSHPVPDTTSGTVAAPGTWTGSGFGITVSSATNLAAKWATGTKFAALTTTPTSIHNTGAAFTANTAHSTSTVVNYRLVVPSSQAVGSYSCTITYTITPTS